MKKAVEKRLIEIVDKRGNRELGGKEKSLVLNRKRNATRSRLMYLPAFNFNRSNKELKYWPNDFQSSLKY